MVTRRLRHALEVLLPGRLESLLLRACLARGEPGRAAWAAFEHHGGNLTELFRTDRGELKRLGPLLLQNLRTNQAAVNADMLTVLKTSYLREELRAKIYLDVLRQTVEALGAAGVDSLVLGGAALGPWVYGEMALRHAHDIDLLVPAGEVERAAAALGRAGFLPTDPGAGPPGGALFLHRTSLPVVLTSSLHELSCHPADWTSLWSRGVAVSSPADRARRLSSEDALAYALGRASYAPARASLQWACDAWRIASATPELNPFLLAGALKESRLALPGAVMLRYLASLGAPVAPDLIEEVEQRAARSTAFERDLALYGLRRGAGVGLGELLRQVSGLATRAAMLRWVLLPSREYLRWAHPAAGPAPVQLLYLRRIWKFFMRPSSA